MFGSVTRSVFRGREAVAAVAAQAVSASAAHVPKRTPSKVVSSALKRVDQQILVCGNLLSWGFHGVAFAPDVDRRDLWAAVADALYRIRRADRLFGNTDLVIVKDVTEPHAVDAHQLKRFSYRPLDTEPNMVLDIAPSWRGYDDYLAGLTANYRKAARVIARDIAAAGYVVERLSDVDGHARTLHDLYLQVHERQKYRMVTLAPEFVPALANAFPADFRVTVVRRDSEVVGFVTAPARWRHCGRLLHRFRQHGKRRNSPVPAAPSRRGSGCHRDGMPQSVVGADGLGAEGAAGGSSGADARLGAPSRAGAQCGRSQPAAHDLARGSAGPKPLQVSVR